MASITDFFDLVMERHSCREFASTPLPRGDIEAMFDAVQVAPSACNRQPWLFLMADTPELRQEVINAYNRPWMENAPLFAIACGDHSEGWKRPSDKKDHTDIDVAIAIEHLCLAATEYGIGSCWICNFDTDKIKKSFNLPPHIEPIAIIAMGHYTYDYDRYAAKKRKPVNEILKWGKY